jgi:hypothetical protein
MEKLSPSDQSDELSEDFSTSNNPEIIPGKKENISKHPACDFCNRRKIKCDGGLPCFQCKKRNKQCHYDRQLIPKEERVKRKLDLTVQLTRQVDALKLELESQTNQAQFWKKKFEELAAKYEHDRKPQFTPDTQQFLQSSSATKIVLDTFNNVIGPFIPGAKFEYSVETANTYWKQFLEQLPEEFFASVRGSSVETLVPMAEYCSIFTLGVKLLNLTDLADQFQSISTSIVTSLLVERDAQYNPNFSNNMASSLLYLIMFSGVGGKYSVIKTLVSTTLGFLDTMEQYISEPILDILYSYLSVASSDPIQRVSWTQKLQKISRNQGMKSNEQKIMATVVYVFCSVTLPDFVYNEEAYHWIDNTLKEIEPLLDGILDNNYKNYYTICVYGIRCGLEISRTHPDTERVGNFIQTTALSFTQLPNNAIRLWMSSLFDYYLYLVSSSNREPTRSKQGLIWYMNSEIKRLVLNYMSTASMNNFPNMETSNSDSSPSNNTNPSPNTNLIWSGEDDLEADFSEQDPDLDLTHQHQYEFSNNF